jgi:peptide chain release factor 2
VRAPTRSGGIFDYDRKALRLNEVNAALENPAVWNEPKRAQDLGKEKRELDRVVETINHLESNLADNLELFDMAKAEGDFDSIETLEGETAKLTAMVEEFEFRRMFNNPADPSNCFIDIQAGAGGTEACDWAGMLLRQYLKYCERKGFKATVEDETPGDVAGLKSATIKVEGEYAFGLLRTEERPGAMDHTPCLRLAVMKASRSPSNTFWVLEISTLVRKSLMRLWSST